MQPERGPSFPNGTEGWSETRPVVPTITLSARNKRASDIHSRYANARHLPCVSLVPTTCPRSVLTSHLGLRFGQLQRPWAGGAEGQVPAPRSRLRSNVARDGDAQSGQRRTGESWQSDHWLQCRLASALHSRLRGGSEQSAAASRGRHSCMPPRPFSREMPFRVQGHLRPLSRHICAMDRLSASMRCRDCTVDN